MTRDIGKPPPVAEITPEPVYLKRREFLKNSLLVAATATGVGATLYSLMGRGRGGLARTGAAPGAVGTPQPPGSPLTVASVSPLSTSEPRTSLDDVTTYNNFYEFGTDKSDPARNAGTLKPRPWTV